MSKIEKQELHRNTSLPIEKPVFIPQVPSESIPKLAGSQLIRMSAIYHVLIEERQEKYLDIEGKARDEFGQSTEKDVQIAGAQSVLPRLQQTIDRRQEVLDALDAERKARAVAKLTKRIERYREFLPEEYHREEIPQPYTEATTPTPDLLAEPHPNIMGFEPDGDSLDEKIALLDNGERIPGIQPRFFRVLELFVADETVDDSESEVTRPITHDISSIGKVLLPHASNDEQATHAQAEIALLNEHLHGFGYVLASDHDQQHFFFTKKMIPVINERYVYQGESPTTLFDYSFDRAEFNDLELPPTNGEQQLAELVDNSMNQISYETETLPTRSFILDPRSNSRKLIQEGDPDEMILSLAEHMLVTFVQHNPMYEFTAPVLRDYLRTSPLLGNINVKRTIDMLNAKFSDRPLIISEKRGSYQLDPYTRITLLNEEQTEEVSPLDS